MNPPRLISFSEPMIQAMQAGKKTVTRRIVNPQPIFNGDVLAGPPKWTGKNFAGMIFLPRLKDMPLECPYGKAGDVLAVREPIINIEGFVAYAADRQRIVAGKPEDHMGELWAWKNQRMGAMYMPRRFSRFKITLTEVRCERLQIITDAEAIDEGAMTLPNRPTYAAEVAAAGNGKPPVGDGPRERFKRLWIKLNGPASWDLDPYVWVLRYDRGAA